MPNNYIAIILIAGMAGIILGFIGGMAAAYFILGDDFQERCQRCRRKHDLEKRILSIGLRDRD